LLDHVFVEVAAKIPSALKLRDGRTKHIFKEAMRGVLPDVIVDRRKQGFGIPLDRWFRGGLGGYVEDLLLSPQALQRGIFEPEFLRKLIAHNNRGRALGSELWTLISFELWCRTFLDQQLSTAASGRSNDRLGASRARVHEAAV
jgi:asparagine synthase (glutamine-hydrolysing)